MSEVWHVLKEILYVTAWLFLLGRSGPLNTALMIMTGSALPVFNVYSLTGMILIEEFLWSPLTFLLLSAVFRAANADFEEARPRQRRRRPAGACENFAADDAAGAPRRRRADRGAFARGL
jgi:hypothetical protein